MSDFGRCVCRAATARERHKPIAPTRRGHAPALQVPKSVAPTLVLLHMLSIAPIASPQGHFGGRLGRIATHCVVETRILRDALARSALSRPCVGGILGDASGKTTFWLYCGHVGQIAGPRGQISRAKRDFG